MKKDAEQIKVELTKSMLTFATAAFGLVAALAWNEAIQGIIKELIPAGNGLLSKLIYAVIVTIIAVSVTFYLGRLVGKAEAKN